MFASSPLLNFKIYKKIFYQPGYFRIKIDSILFPRIEKSTTFTAIILNHYQLITSAKNNHKLSCKFENNLFQFIVCGNLNYFNYKPI